MSTNGRSGGGTPGDADRDPRLDRLYGEIPHDEPPAHLDAAILAAAHREVGARPRSASERLRAWRVPVSIAAVVVLSVSVVTLVREEGGDKLDSSTASMASRNVSRAPAAQTAEERASTRDRAAPAESAPDAGRARTQEAARPEAAQRKAARDDAVPASNSSAKEEADRRAATESAKLTEQTARSRSAGAAAELSGSMEPRAPVPPPAAPAPPSPPQAGPALRDPRPAPSTGAASGADVARSSIGIRGSSGDTPFAPNPEEQKSQGSASAPQGTPDDRPMARERASAADSAGSLSMQRPAPAQPAAKAAPRVGSRSMQAEGSAATANRLSPLLKELETQPAEKWVEKIEALRRDGRRSEADELLAEFKRRFPDYPLPAALRP
ncbi:MAG TPA: hypothetical protein VJQ51_02235 [Burkholderiales bacterium]|nr:hypothetical protein [Burkholderiales bacterium]